MTTRRPNHRRGFMLLDMIGGILLLAAASSLLITAIVRQGRVAARLKEDRAAVRRAESALATLADASPTTMPTDVTLRPLPDPAAAGWQWVTVSVPSGPRRVELTGLVRAGQNAEAR